MAQDNVDQFLGRWALQFEEGIVKTVEWYLDNEEWLNNILSGDYEKYYQDQYEKR